MECNFTKPNGEKCRSYALKKDNFCFFHSEATIIARKNAVDKGGKSKKRNYGNSSPLKLENSTDVLVLLEQTALDLRMNKSNSNIANALNCIANTAIKAIELRYMEYQKRPSKLDRSLDKLLYE